MQIIIDGEKVLAILGQTILQVAKANGIYIPTLCHSEALEPAAMCRLCTVEIDEGRGERLVTACNYPLRRSARIITSSKRVRLGRKFIIEFLYSRCQGSELLQQLAHEYDADLNRFMPNDKQCIVCGLCVRVCDQVGGKTLTLSGRGVEIKVSTAFNRASEYCIACGACVRICPVRSIQMLEEEGERRILLQGKEISRVKLANCVSCGKYFNRFVDFKKIAERVGVMNIPSPNLDFCPDCSRHNLAIRMAERYFEQYEAGNAEG